MRGAKKKGDKLHAMVPIRFLSKDVRGKFVR